MPFLKEKKIALGVTGSIAAYKAAEIVSLLVKKGAEVQVLMTREAEEFITPLTLKTLSRRPVLRGLWDNSASWKPGHIDIADWADLFLVAPATAHIISCFAHGLAPETLSCVYLAARGPVVIAPAMNVRMLEHPATQANMNILRERGNIIVEPDEGLLACGDSGKGKLAAPTKIVEKLEGILKGISKDC